MTHVEMMRVLQAEESLRRITEIAAGNGLIKDAERRPILAQWRRDAMIDKPREPTTLDTLIGNGIGLQVIKKGDPIE